MHIHCPDRKGLVAAVSGFIHQHRGNVLHLDQHVDVEQNVFFMRMEWTLDDFASRFEPLASSFKMNWQIFDARRQRMAIFVSKQPHCLHDILSRHEAGECAMDIPLIIRNHPDLRHIADRFGIPFHHIPITADTKAAQEEWERGVRRRFRGRLHKQLRHQAPTPIQDCASSSRIWASRASASSFNCDVF